MTWISCLAAESLSHRHRPRTYFCIDVLRYPDVRCMSLPGGPLLHLTSPPHQPTRDIQPDPENAPERGGPRALAARCGEAESACVSASLERSFWGSVAWRWPLAPPHPQTTSRSSTPACLSLGDLSIHISISPLVRSCCSLCSLAAGSMWSFPQPSQPTFV